MSRQFEDTNIKLSDQLKETYEEKIKYMKQVNILSGNIKELEQIK